MHRILGLVIASVAAGACSQVPPPPVVGTPPSTAIASSLRETFDMVRGYVQQASEQMAEGDYGFKPVGVAAEVRSFGQIVGHIADSNYLFCSASSGDPRPEVSLEETLRTRTELTRVLAESFDFCQRAFAALDDQTGAEPAVIAPLNNLESTRLGVLAFATAHDYEHYGNLVTYLRARGLVPPSSPARRP